MKKKYQLVVLFIFLLVNEAIGKEWTTLTKEEMTKALLKVAEWYKNETYSVEVAHNSYSSFTSNMAFERSYGYVKKSHSNYHSFLLGIHTVQNEKIKLIVDSVSKQIALTLPDKLFELVFTSDDYLLLLDYVTAMKQRANVTDRTLRLEFDENNQVGAYEFIINKQGFLKSMVVYYNHEVLRDEKTRNETEVRPRLEIIFANYTKNPFFDFKEEFDEKKYINFSTGNKPKLNSAYKKYSLSDQRIPVKK